jgi:PAS domain S-box-containing protein
MIQDPNAPLLSELRWFVAQRWYAGVVVILGTLMSQIWIDWSGQRSGVLAVGISILAYNSIFWEIFRRAPRWIEGPIVQRLLAWAQIALDLACLAMLSIYTGGILSPLLGFFVLHMIFASILLQSSRYMPYAAWALALALLGVSLLSSGQWPASSTERLIAAGWAGTLLMTIYFTTHITMNVNASHEQTRAVLDAAADGVLIVDDSGNIKLANPAALDMFGYTSAQLINQRVDRVLAIADPEDFSRSPWSIHSNGDTATPSDHQLTTTAARSDGSSFPIELSMSEMKLGSKQAYTIVVRDISDRQRVEEELRLLNEELKAHQMQLIQHEKMVAVGRMAAGVAHEIANPLANMDGLIQLVERNPDRMKADTPEQIREQIARITQIVHQLKDFAHPIDTNRTAVSVDELIQSTIAMIRFDHRHRNVAVEKDLANPCCHISVHPQSIQQVLVNLMVNALDAEREDEKVRVSISSQCIQDARCMISIRDNGTGIPQDHLNRIFEPFFTTKPIGQGTGLGLSISYNLVQRDGGEIEVKSQEGVGTQVTLIFPVWDRSS